MKSAVRNFVHILHDKRSGTGLPDGLFSNQKSQFGLILEGLAMENLGIFYDHLDYFRAIGNIL
jgi:hypothetical protein